LLSFNHGQTCCAGSRIFVQAPIYDEFLAAFTKSSKEIKLGNPFHPEVSQGPQVSEVQFNVCNLLFNKHNHLPFFFLQYKRIMSYIESGKQDGATLHLGGTRHGSEGFFIEPTIFTDTSPEMKIVKEEIFGPVGVVIKFEDEDGMSSCLSSDVGSLLFLFKHFAADVVQPFSSTRYNRSNCGISDVVKQANDTIYGLAAAVFTSDINRAIRTAHRLKAGTVWVRLISLLSAHPSIVEFVGELHERGLPKRAFRRIQAKWNR
jgi:aldehyde dehydrogenase (NAD+)